MKLQAIREVLRATPFTRFRIQMASGRSFHVPDPDFVAVSYSGSWLIVITPEDHTHHLDLLTITELEIDEAPSDEERQAG